MTIPQTRSLNIPFPGFYASTYSDALDSEESQWIEYEAGESPDGELAHPIAHRLSEVELVDLLFDHTDHRASHIALAKEYCGAFATCASAEIGVPLDLRFDNMISPREYNFETDRIFATIPLAAVRALYALSRADGHATLARTIVGRHTSYSGFHSFYSADIADWIAKPVATWDANELSTLLLACIALSSADMHTFAQEVYEETDTGSGEFYHAWSTGVDWEAFEAAREALRAVKIAASPAPDDQTDES